MQEKKTGSPGLRTEGETEPSRRPEKKKTMGREFAVKLPMEGGSHPPQPTDIAGTVTWAREKHERKVG